MPTIKALRRKYSRYIALGDLDILLADTLQKNLTYLHSYPEGTLNFWQLLILRYRIWQRKHGYSVAVIIGHKEFFGLDFKVNRHTLIPRPETELLVEEALKNLNFQTTLIDVGTGSGCIPISILKNATVPAYATDISLEALKIAKQNATRHAVAIQFLEGNLLEPLPQTIFQNHLVITANLPYLSREQFINEPSIQREPYQALVAENNGLALYEELLQQLRKKNSTHPVTLLFEIDPSQIKTLPESIFAYFPRASVEIKNDLAGQGRLIITKLNS